MKTEPVVPARIAFDADDGTPWSPEFGDVYHARAGALAQARHVFLGGNGLPARWAGRRRFVVLETGFGLGNNFLATWAAWRDDPSRCERLHFVSVEKHPPTRADLGRAHAASALLALARQLSDAWPPLTPNLHTLAFEGGHVVLLLALGDAARWLPELVAEVDAFYLDGFAPARNPAMWDGRLLRGLSRLAAPGATAATWSAARGVRDGLAAAGFAVERAPGFGGKQEMTVAHRVPSSYAPRRPPGRVPGGGARDALVVGGRLAGASTAQALALEGLECLVLDAEPPAGRETAGGLGGLFHGTVHADDGPHARFNRAAALEARRQLHPLLAGGLVAGGADGLLRLESALGVPGMGRRIARLGLPADYVLALDAAQASSRCALPLHHPAWYYPGGGWLDPVALVRLWLATPGVHFRAGVTVRALGRAGDRWQALDGQGRVVGEAGAVVLAAAHGTAHLLGDPPWPLSRLRGQVTRLPPGAVPAPRVPVVGAGYALALPDGSVLCGATKQRDDDDPALREADQRYNLDRLHRLTGARPPAGTPLDGRVGWRWTAVDRLPLLGPVPQPAAAGARMDQPRFVPREQGLFVHSALGSRGITWAPLGARLIAAWITGAPLPLEASLLDAVDAARFVARAARTPRQVPG